MSCPRQITGLLILILSAVLIGPTWSHAADDEKPAAKAPAKKVSLAGLVIKGGFPESPGSPGLFGELETNLREIIRRLDAAAKDTKLSGVVLRIENAQIGRGKLSELRAAVARARKAGKKVYALIDSADGPQYQLASACDEIVMPPSGTLMIPGVAAELMFYKGLLDKVGIEADMLQVGKFKGAAEPYSRTGMSKEFRQQFEAVVDDYYAQMIETIAADRSLKAQRVKQLIDQGLFTAAAAKKAGLVDRVLYEDEFQDGLKKQLQADEVAVTKNYGKKKIDTDFSGFTGMMKLMQIMLGGEPTARSSRKPKIAVVYAVGVIMPGNSTSSIFGEQTLGSSTIVKALRKADEDETVKAIVLRVDSPGGSALASDLIWREIVRIKKPVIASMGDVAASGGYYISMGTDKIYAEPGTLTGSIGVVGGKLAMKGLYDKLGLNVETIRRGKNVGAFSSTEKFSDSEREVWKKMMADIYDQFTSKAAAGRKMDREKLESLAQGRVWTGRMAAGNGLVDKLGTLQDAVADARKMGGLKEDDDVETLVLPKATSFFDQLFGTDTDARIGAGRQIGAQLQTLAPELSAAVGDLDTLRRLFAEPGVIIMPYRVRIK